MFVTECPECQAKFRVTDGQLRLANGRVRCGNCLSIFDAENGRTDRTPTTATEQPQQTSTGAQFAQLDAEPIVLERFNSQPESPFKTALMILILLLCAVLGALQYLWFERARLNAHPSLRPFYIIACSQINCDLSAKEGLTLLTIEQTLVREHPRYSNGVSVVSNSRITVTDSGIYNLQWSGQFDNSNSQDDDVRVWIKVNGTNLTGSTGYVSIPQKHGASNGHIIVGWNYFLSLTANDYVELWWETDSTTVTIQSYAAGTNYPSTASLIATMQFVSNTL